MENNLYMKSGFTLNSGQSSMSFVFTGEGNQASGILWMVFISGLLLLLPERTFCEKQSSFKKFANATHFVAVTENSWIHSRSE